MEEKNFFDDVFNLLPLTNFMHSKNSWFYNLIEEKLKTVVINSGLSLNGNGNIDFGPFNKLKFPFYKMGAINSLHLFGLDEIIIFSFYLQNKDRYKYVADIGANIGLHSIMMSKCGWKIDSYEPDPEHQNVFLKNVSLNNEVNNINLNRMAVSSESGKTEFTRVLGNTTGSHISGSKDDVYGVTEKFEIDVIGIKKIMHKFDFIKMDVEGQEQNIISKTDKSDWLSTDMILEVGNFKNAEKIFNHLRDIGVNCFSQKNNWKQVSKLNQMPENHREGSLFISFDDKMFWR